MFILHFIVFIFITRPCSDGSSIFQQYKVCVGIEIELVGPRAICDALCRINQNADNTQSPSRHDIYRARA